MKLQRHDLVDSDTALEGASGVDELITRLGDGKNETNPIMGLGVINNVLSSLKN